MFLLLLVVLSAPTDPAVVDTAAEIATGHRRGKPVPLALAPVQGAIRMEIEAAMFFAWMAEAADLDGLKLRVRSGFRSHAKQRWLRRCFETCTCNDCRRAARSGFSTHETGRAVDIVVTNPKVRAWLDKHAAKFGFVRTVKSEPWHYEYFER